MELVLMMVAMGAIMYFLMIRPQQKRMKEHQETIAALQTGTRVLLTSGVYATVRHLGERQAIVELAPGSEVTILKGNIARPVLTDEEEFEYTDDMAADRDEPGDDMIESEFGGASAPAMEEPSTTPLDHADAFNGGSELFDPRPAGASDETRN